MKKRKISCDEGKTHVIISIETIRTIFLPKDSETFGVRNSNLYTRRKRAVLSQLRVEVHSIRIHAIQVCETDPTLVEVPTCGEKQ